MMPKNIPMRERARGIAKTPAPTTVEALACVSTISDAGVCTCVYEIDDAA